MFPEILFWQEQAGLDGSLIFSQSKLERYTVQCL